MEWKPIETAPQDGTWVLISGGRPDYHHDDDNPARIPPCVVARVEPYSDGYRWFFCSYDCGYYGEYENPTRWMPIPTQEPQS